MGLLDIFKKKKRSITDVVSNDNVNNFVVIMSNTVSKKCNYGKDIGILNEYERIFFVAQELECEVNNGGFEQFFYNSSGDFAGEIVSAFTKLGALKTAGICQKALDAFGVKLPSNRDDREELLDKILNEKISAILDECDDKFYEYEEDLVNLNYEYIMKNRSSFDEIK